MVVSRDKRFASPTRLILAISAAASFCAAVAATPSASIGKESSLVDSAVSVTRPAAQPGDAANALRPLARGPAIKVGRAFDAEDEDCTVAVTRYTDQSGRVGTKRSLTCAQ